MHAAVPGRALRSPHTRLTLAATTHHHPAPAPLAAAAHGPPQRHRLAALQPSAPAEHQGSAPAGGSAPASPRGIFGRLLAWWRQLDSIEKFVVAGRVFAAVSQVAILSLVYSMLCWFLVGRMIWAALAVNMVLWWL